MKYSLSFPANTADLDDWPGDKRRSRSESDLLSSRTKTIGAGVIGITADKRTQTASFRSADRRPTIRVSPAVFCRIQPNGVSAQRKPSRTT